MKPTYGASILTALMADTDISVASTKRGGPRQRSAIACELCHSRRVKCNAAANGLPCSNCKATGFPCRLIESKRGRKRKLKSSPGQNTHIYSASANVHTPHDACARLVSPAGSRDEVENQVTFQSLDPGHGKDNPSSTTEGPETLYAQILEKAEKAESAEQQNNATGSVSHIMYMGETFNLTHLLQQTSPVSRQHVHKRHYTIQLDSRRRAQLGHGHEDDAVSDFLRRQGAFIIPPLRICEELFRVYFKFVHPHYPIIDRLDFASQYADLASPSSYLLLQAVLFMASGHCDVSLLQDAGFSSRYDARSILFKRAKTLYDADFEYEKVTIVQSLFLMSFWWNGPTDQKDTWHWLGNAISLAVTIGMHRSARLSDMNLKDQRLWKKIWWTLFTEDKHAAAALGRPVHIHFTECDVEALEEEDFDEEPVPNTDIFGIQNNVDVSYVIALSKLSPIVERILENSFNASNQTNQAGVDALESCSNLLNEWKAQLPEELHLEHSGECLWTSMLHIAHRYVCYHSSRLHIKKTDFDNGNSWFEILAHRSAPKEELSMPPRISPHKLAHDAANRMIRIVEDLLSSACVLHCPIHIVPALFAAMGMHAVNICSGNSVLEQLGYVKVRLCMIALRELSSTWPVSGWILLLFSKIVRRIRNQDEFRSETFRTRSRNESHCAPARPDGDNLEHSTTINVDAQSPALEIPHVHDAPFENGGREAMNFHLPPSYPTDWTSIFDDGLWDLGHDGHSGAS